MRTEFVDLHHHLLHGMDDGPRRFDETAGMLHRAAEQGVRQLAATPHIRPGHAEFNMDVYLKRLEMARKYARANGLALKIWPGAEIMYTVAAVEWLRKGRVPLLGDGWHALVEFYPDASFAAIGRAVLDIGNAGFGVVLAHAERYRALHWGDRLAQLKEDCGVKVQINSLAVLSSGGLLGGRWIRRILKEGLVDVVASDAHGTEVRPCIMKECASALEALCGKAAAEKMMIENPAVLLSGKGELRSAQEEECVT